MRFRGSRALYLILAVALAARIGVILATPDFKPLFDAADFDRHATSLADGDGYPRSQLEVDGPTAFRPPLYPVTLAIVKVFGGGWGAERVLGALLGVATVLLIYLLARRLWEERVANIAGATAAIFPPLVVLSATLLSELLFLPLVLGSVLAVLEYRDSGRLRWAALAGLLCGLAVLTRVNGLPIVLALALGTWTIRPLFSRAGLLAPATVVAVTLLTLIPWVIRNTVEFDRWVGLTTAGGFALAGTYNSESRAEAKNPGEPFSPNRLDIYRDELARHDLDEDELIGVLNDQAVDYIKDHPGYVVETALWNVLRLADVERSDPFEETFTGGYVQAGGVEKIDSPVLNLGFLYAVLALALVGIGAQAAGMGPRRAPLFVWAVPVLLLIPPLAIFGLPRYRVPGDPFLILLAAVAAAVLLDRVVGQRASDSGLSSSSRTRARNSAPSAP